MRDMIYKTTQEQVREVTLPSFLSSRKARASVEVYGPAGVLEFRATWRKEDAYVGPRALCLQHFYVSEEYRRQGLGTAFLNMVENLLAACGIQVDCVYGMDMILEQQGIEPFLLKRGVSPVQKEVEGGYRLAGYKLV